MTRTPALSIRGDVLTIESYFEDGESNGRTYTLVISSEAELGTVQASLAMLDTLLGEKVAQVRARRIEEMVDFFASCLIIPNAGETAMAGRLAERHARLLDEFGYCTAEELADLNRSRASNRSALANNWRKRRQIFAVPYPDRLARERDVYPAFQFEGGKPIKTVQGVLQAFNDHKAAWKVALWFTSNNGWLPDNARPVDVLKRNPEAVIKAAQREAQGSAI